MSFGAEHGVDVACKLGVLWGKMRKKGSTSYFIKKFFIVKIVEA